LLCEDQVNAKEDYLLEVKDLKAGYGEIQVLFGVSIFVTSGSMVTVLGANGAGKSTLVRAIMGMVDIRSGDVVFEGSSIKRLPPHKIVKRGVVSVPEGRHLFPYLTVLENLQMGAYTADRKEEPSRLKAVFELFPILNERQRQLAITLSGGQQQMLAIGRALMANPKLLILDEPSLGLAPMIVDEVFDIIKEIHARGTSILLIEQNVELSLEICDYAYVLETGKITLQGSGKELLSMDDVRRSYLGV